MESALVGLFIIFVWCPLLLFVGYKFIKFLESKGGTNGDKSGFGH